MIHHYTVWHGVFAALSIHYIAFCRYGNTYWIEHDIRYNQVLEKKIIQNKYDIKSSSEFKCILSLH